MKNTLVLDIFSTFNSDLNNDGRLNGKEVSSTDIDHTWMNNMRRVDKNRDGSISRPELKEYLVKESQSSRNERSVNMHTNGANDFILKMFSGKDKDGDGFISFEEFRSRNEEL